jgi:hypothetical protein
MKKYKNRPRNSIIGNSRRRRQAREAALYSFDASPTLEELAEAQGVSPVASIDDLRGDFWPDDQSAEDFIAIATAGRYEEDMPDS